MSRNFQTVRQRTKARTSSISGRSTHANQRHRSLGALSSLSPGEPEFRFHQRAFRHAIALSHSISAPDGGLAVREQARGHSGPNRFSAEAGAKPLPRRVSNSTSHLPCACPGDFHPHAGEEREREMERDLMRNSEAKVASLPNTDVSSLLPASPSLLVLAIVVLS